MESINFFEIIYILKLNKNLINKENEELILIYKKVNEILLKRDFKSLNNESKIFNNEKDNLINILKQLKTKEEINQLMESFKNFELNSSNNDSKQENLANKLKDEGNIYYTNKKYLDAIKSYSKALQDCDCNPPISNFTKSLILHNKSISNIELFKKYSKDDNDKNGKTNFKSLIEAQDDAIESCILRSSWFKPYWRIGQTYHLMGQYEFAILFYKTALFLEKNNKDIEEMLTSAEAQLKIMISNGDDGRDYERESSEYLKINKFKEFNQVNDIDLPKPYTNSELGELEMVSGLSKQWWLDRSIDNDAHTFIKEGKYDIAYKYLCKTAKNGFPNSLYGLSILYENGWGVEKDLKKSFSLAMEAANKPIKNKVNNQLGQSRDSRRSFSNNNGVVESQDLLAKKYEYGIGIDIDLGAAFHYYKKSADNNHLNACYHLSLMIINEKSPQSLGNKEKQKQIAIDYLKKGINENHDKCIELYDKIK
ncbi:hypothetical protein RB653_000454 [Dictyostelium firmibasis]|uniref:HCP-like protein n=1 Tax=Dictyostelium firmibasis TaxID=79012 RepID=A0AAN7U2B8_9MYCE